MVTRPLELFLIHTRGTRDLDGITPLDGPCGGKRLVVIVSDALRGPFRETPPWGGEGAAEGRPV